MKTYMNSTRRAAHMLMAVMAAFTLLLAVAPGAEAKGDQTEKDTSVVLAAIDSCPSGWVDGRTGCEPGSFTTEGDKAIYYVVLGTKGCPTGWVTASVPGGCLPGSYTRDAGVEVYAYSGHCPAEFDCDGWQDAMESFGYYCYGSQGGVSCTEPENVGPVD